MEDTPEHIKKLQLKIWLQKTPGERLRQFLLDNEALFIAWQKIKENNQSKQKAKGENQED